MFYGYATGAQFSPVKIMMLISSKGANYPKWPFKLPGMLTSTQNCWTKISQDSFEIDSGFYSPVEHLSICLDAQYLSVHVSEKG